MSSNRARAAVVALLAFLVSIGIPSITAAAPASGPPLGNLERVAAVAGGIEIKGWALDPDTAASIYLWVTVDGVGSHQIANDDRADIDAAFPGYGPRHGFRRTLTAAPGSHRVCVTAVNVGPGSHTSLGCSTQTVRDLGSPIGNIERAAAGGGGIEIKGWALDPDSANSIYLWVTVDGAGRHILANEHRADVGAAYPGAGSLHGFRTTLSAGPGSHRVCITAVNVGPGSHKSLGCRVAAIPDSAPIGNLESAVWASGAIQVKGWALDRDTTGPIYVWISTDPGGRHLVANQNRPDVAAAYPGYGPSHGFSGSFGASAGTHTVCATAVNVGSGANQQIGCRKVTVPGPSGGASWRPSSPDLDCPDFATWAEAQATYLHWLGTLGDVHNLDGDNDLIACESHFGV